MVTVPLAQRLLAAGLVWDPHPGDRFVIPGREMDDDVFVVSQMVVDVHEFPDGRVIGFNGTTEWAMDSLELTEALWLPWEGQLREQLGVRFAGLWRDGDEWVVAVENVAPQGIPERELAPGYTDPDESVREYRDPDCESAYAAALLSVLDFA